MIPSSPIESGETRNKNQVISVCGVLDMSPYFDDGVFQRLRDPEVFRTARAGVNTVEWDNGAIDIAPETAYENAVPLK